MSLLSPRARRVQTLFQQEFGQLRPLQHALALLSRLIPLQTGRGMRVALLRARGVEVGEGTIVYDTPVLSGGEPRGLAKLSIGADSVIDLGCEFELGESITIGDRVALGHHVMVLTTTHELGPREHRAGTAVRSKVRIEDGAWIGPRATVLPGVTIGKGAVVEPGSVVNKDVPPNTRVRGAPARSVEELAP